MVRASASGAEGRGFNFGPGHTKDFINGTSIALSIERQELASVLQTTTSVIGRLCVFGVLPMVPLVSNICTIV